MLSGVGVRKPPSFSMCPDQKPDCGNLSPELATMVIETTAPTRVDLAGGTIDIWPLYLLHEGAVTVNIAVDLPARCRIEPRSDRRIVLRSVDGRESAEFEDVSSLASSRRLTLLAKLVYFFAPPSGLEMTTESSAPPGAGLAGSSALNIAICAGLNRLCGEKYDLESLIRIAKNVEAQVIAVPTGEQDYYPAAYGGLQAIHFSPAGVRREEIRTDLERLSEKLILVYSGVPRNSGINNWEVMKRRIDGEGRVQRAFDGIILAANRTLEALRRGRIDEIDEALAEEWEHRRTLSEGITTPEIDEIIAIARSLGARAAKVCGAGGGGCLVLTVPEGQRQKIQSGLREHRVQVLDYGIARDGVTFLPD
jgi:D-glycero-alpha-D-manno-heptose-7-phosphate kinase